MEKKGRTYIEIVGVMLVLQLLLNALLFSVWHIGYILGGVDGALRGLSSVRTVRWEFSRMRWEG